MNEKYSLLKLLGEGSYGKCFLVQAHTANTQYVIKQIEIKHMTPSEKDETIKEAGILGSLDHPYIVKLKEAFISKKGKLCIVMDYADGGDLSTIIKSRNGVKFSEDQILTWFVQICLALKHVHDRKILHRDLKSQNIFLTKEGAIKLGDFGIAKVLNQTMENAKTMVGTPFYLSPELIDNKPYNFKSDIWSLGVLLYEMCALEPPFNSNSIHGLALKIVRGVYPPLSNEYSRELRLVLANLLAVDPRQRPTIHEVLKNPLILSRIQKYLSENKFKEEFSHTIIHSKNPEDKSKKRKKKILGDILRKREELDREESANIKDQEKILYEMSALVLEDEIDQDIASPNSGFDSQEIKSDEVRVENSEKVEQFRSCLIEMLGNEVFEEAYLTVSRISAKETNLEFGVFYDPLKHIMNNKAQKKFIPMLQALIQMENP